MNGFTPRAVALGVTLLSALALTAAPAYARFNQAPNTSVSAGTGTSVFDFPQARITIACGRADITGNIDATQESISGNLTLGGCTHLGMVINVSCRSPFSPITISIIDSMRTPDDLVLRLDTLFNCTFTIPDLGGCDISVGGTDFAFNVSYDNAQRFIFAITTLTATGTGNPCDRARDMAYTARFSVSTPTGLRIV